MKNPDVLVIGGGIVGSSIVRALIAKGLTVKCFEESSNPSNSATLASGAMLGALGEITHAASTPADEIETKFRLLCARAYPSWLESLANDESKTPCRYEGTIIISNTSGKDDHLNIKAIENAAIRFGESVESITENDVPALAPHQSCRPQQILFLPNEGFIDSNKLLRALRSANKRRCQDLYIDTPVSSLLTDKDRVTGVKIETGETYTADSVILCCGIQTNGLLQESGLVNTGLPKIISGKGSSITITSDVKFEHVVRTPNRDFACGTHIVPRGDGVLYLGATNRISATPGSDGGITTGEMHAQLHSAIHEINTSFRTDKITGYRSGLRPLCTDGYPVFGKTEIPGLLIATGTYRNGVLMAAQIADTVAADVDAGASKYNPFAPSERQALSICSPVDETIRVGVRDLVSFLQEPHGSLPYNRAQELEDFIVTLLENSLTNSDVSRSLSDSTGVEVSPDLIAEMIPSMLYGAHLQKSCKRNELAANTISLKEAGPS